MKFHIFLKLQYKITSNIFKYTTIKIAVFIISVNLKRSSR